MKRIGFRTVLMMVAGHLLGACSSSAEVMAHDAWSRPVPPVSPASAIFLEVANGLDTAITLTGATSEACGALELHETSIGDTGVMAMRPLPGGLTVAAGETSRLEPGGIHLMCIEPAVFEGSFDVTLQIGNAPDLAVPVVIEDR